MLQDDQRTSAPRADSVPGGAFGGFLAGVLSGLCLFAPALGVLAPHAGFGGAFCLVGVAVFFSFLGAFVAAVVLWDFLSGVEGSDSSVAMALDPDLVLLRGGSSFHLGPRSDWSSLCHLGTLGFLVSGSSFIVSFGFDASVPEEGHSADVGDHHTWRQRTRNETTLAETTTTSATALAPSLKPPVTRPLLQTLSVL